MKGYWQKEETRDRRLAWSQAMEHYEMLTAALLREIARGNWEEASSILDERKKVMEEMESLLAGNGGIPEAREIMFQLMDGEERILDLALEARRKLVDDMKGLSQMMRWAKGVRDISHGVVGVGRFEILG